MCVWVQVMSPQRIPATVAPNLLLSPSVFVQTKATRAEPEPAEPRALSKTQLQATLLHLIKVRTKPMSIWIIPTLIVYFREAPTFLT